MLMVEVEELTRGMMKVKIALENRTEVRKKMVVHWLPLLVL